MEDYDNNPNDVAFINTYPECESQISQDKSPNQRPFIPPLNLDKISDSSTQNNNAKNMLGLNL